MRTVSRLLFVTSGLAVCALFGADGRTASASPPSAGTSSKVGKEPPAYLGDAKKRKKPLGVSPFAASSADPAPPSAAYRARQQKFLFEAAALTSVYKEGTPAFKAAYAALKREMLATGAD